MSIDPAAARLPPLHPRSPDQRTSFSGSEFDQIFAAESEYVERKTGASPEKLAQAMVAFSNADGGVLLIGVSDDGHRAARRLAGTVDRTIHEAARNARNLGPYAAREIDVDGTPLVAVTVGPTITGVAQMSDGRVLARRGASNSPVFGADLFALLQGRSHERFEQIDSHVPLSASSPAAVQEVVDAYGWSQAEVPERLVERRLLRRDGGTLTVAGALLLCDPLPARFAKAVVEVRRYRDEDSVDYDLRETFAGPVAHQVVAARDFIMREVGSEMLIAGLYRREVPRLPEVVVRETLANAVAHRDYALAGSATVVEIRPGRVLVTSPGGFPPGVTSTNIRSAQAARNVDVITVLRALNLAEDAGRGVDTIVDAMAEALLAEPTFTDVGESVRVELPVVPATTPQERAWVLELAERGQLEPPQRMLLIAAARGERLTNSRARFLVGGDSREAMQWLRHLADLGLLHRSGERGGTNYTLDPQVAPAGARVLDLGRVRDQLIAEAGRRPLTNVVVRQLLHVDQVEARRLLQQLVGEGVLQQEGERRFRRYVLRRPQGQ